MSKKVWRNPFSGQRFRDASACFSNVEIANANQLKELGISAAQAVFNARNNYPIGQKMGKSALTGKPTKWNEQAKRYERFADEQERGRYREIFVARMTQKYGKAHLLNNPDQQRKMLESRKISGTYKFRDGAVKSYTGNYELDFLEFMDTVLEWPSEDIHSPAPQTFYYKDTDGTEHFYIPDFWIESLNLFIEIKSGENQHYRLRDLAIERQKDRYLQNTDNNYFKILDKKYGDFLEYLSKLINDF